MKCCTALLVVLCMAPPSEGQPVFIDPIEYLRGDDGNFVPLTADQGDLVQQTVEVRTIGERTNRWITGLTTPTVTVYRPAGVATASVVVCPGGGYTGLSFDKEGTFVAEWLKARGVNAVVLKSHVYAGEPLGDQPLRDAQEAVRFARKRWPDVPLGVVGFSAGGHLAASVANSPPEGVAAKDWVAFHALIYPVISMRDGVTHGGSRRNLLGDSPSEPLITRFSMDERVTPDSPPAFVVHTADDTTVPVANSLRYTAACQEAGVPVELHVYPTGGHGYGMWSEQGTVATWPAAFEAWLRDRGVIAE